MSQLSSFQITSAEFRSDPYAILSYLREHNPIARVGIPGDRFAWLVTRYEDIEVAIKEPRLSPDPHEVYTAEMLDPIFPQGAFSDAILSSMVFRNPPDHTRLRKLVGLSFTPRFVEQWHDRVQEITDSLIDQLPEHGEIDLIASVSFPLPMLVISEMLGVPNEDREKFHRWSNLYTDAMGNPDANQRIRQEMNIFYSYLYNLLEEKRQHPSGDLLSQLLQAESAGDKLTIQELVGMTVLLILAGNETTASLVANAMLTLFQHPDQLALLKARPELMPAAIEEILRFKAPVFNTNERWVTEDFQFCGQEFKKGELVYLNLASGNRDEERFPNADVFDITRKDAQHHLGFSKGIHYCLGAPLARLEGRIALNTILRCLPDIRLNAKPEELVWRPGTVLFSMTTFPVAY